ncbi:MAG: SAM-dependent methyltransferase [Candidatus Dadabacteria bacterium]|nr:SAM-dependent methyltransferase [Candidatus Dadabacteria bacterium]MDE0663901.1 SAM-dependent methyltransferase [Candidatus Dadabacteria bacterium]
MSDINEVGTTAFAVACYREMEQNREHRVFNDPYAHWFVTDEIREKVDRVTKILPESVEILRYRFCILDEITRREIQAGMKQIVILGCGFDMRSLVFETEGVRFCDVDQPSLLEFKRKVLESRGVKPCASIPCNYLEADLPEELIKAGFDINSPIFFLWEGNSMYLPLELIHSFFDSLCARIPSFKIAFDYYPLSVINRTHENPDVVRATDMFQKTFNVTWVTGFDDLSVFEKRHGMKVEESTELLEVGKQVAPEAVDSVAPLVGAYSYGILSYGGA